MVVGQQRALDGLAGGVVVPDGGGQGEDALQDADGDALRGMPAVAFQVELAFEGFVDGLDDLAQRPEELRAGPGLLASDALMLGIDPNTQRDRMAEALDVILRFFKGEIVTEKTDSSQVLTAPRAGS